jgi:PAS domain S-box-containing protein
MRAAVKTKEGFSTEIAKSRQKKPQVTKPDSPWDHVDEPYRALFEQSRDAIYITTREGAFSDVNQAFLDLFCYTRDEITRLKGHETYANPTDRSRFQKEIEDSGSVRDFEVRLRKKDGTEMECLLTASLRRADDRRVLGYQGIIRDISQQKRAEELLRLTQFSIQHSSEAAFWISADARFYYVNEAACRSLGYSREELLEMTVQDIDPGFQGGIWA